MFVPLLFADVLNEIQLLKWKQISAECAANVQQILFNINPKEFWNY